MFDPQVSLQYQMTVDELNELPGFGPYYTHWFRPGGDDPKAPPVVDPSTGQFRFFFKGNTLYVGLDSDDQAISGNSIEDRGDGMRFTVRSHESEDGDPFAFNGFLALIDSTGALDVLTEPDSIADPQVALALKGSSTIADPNDIDEGYQIEMAIDLTTIPGYEGGLGDDRIIWIGATYFDGDYLPDPADYGMRTWWLVERGGGPFGGPAARTWLDPNATVAVEGGPGALPAAVSLMGSYPNPFGGAARSSTELLYALPEAGTVTVTIYDVMGREVVRLVPGAQAAGPNRVTFDATGLASGVYVYRVRLDGARGVAMSEAGQVTVVK
ncbi:MAG TPA: T9SS type A sorting domain-containing protein [Acidimicrobiales bacterium]|nr:T9SS type A sorting domain-containing protein [Acidimicrobiales bacterium]